MSFSGGVYTLPGPALNTGEIVSASENNTFRNDVATAFNLTFLRNGTSTATANLPMGGYKLTGLGAATTSGDALSYGQAATVSDLTASGTVTISSGTANGVAYLNGSKVLTTGSALTFDGTKLVSTNVVAGGGTTLGSGTLTVNGNAAISNGGTLFLWSSGNTYAPSITAPGDAIAFSSNASEQMRLTSTGLGIGTSSPACKLHSAVSGNNIAFKASRTDYDSYLTVDFIAGYTNFDCKDLYTFKVAGTERMRLDPSGNLGLGVTPSAWIGSYRTLNIGDSGLLSSRTGASINNVELGVNWFRNSGGSFVYKANGYGTNYQQYDGSHYWYTAPSGTAGNAISFTQAMTLDASGNLGIGTSSPAAKLHVANGAIRLTNAYEIGWGDNSVYLSGTDVSGTMLFYTNSLERARIDAAGNLLVGTTTLYGKVTSEALGGNQTESPFSANVTSAAGVGACYVLRSLRGGTQVGSITNTSTATAYNTSSDYRLKENIQPMQNALGVVQQLKPVTYTWKADGSDGQGFIAHELQAVVPDCVTGEKDAVDADGKPVYQGIDTSFLVATLCKAIQELEARVKQLEGK